MKWFWAALVDRPEAARRGRPCRPSVDGCETRALLSGAGAHVAAIAHAGAHATFSEVLARYRTFEGSSPIGHGQTLSVRGPIVLGLTDARGQVVGYLYPTDGSARAAVVGLVANGGVSLQITMADGRKLHAAGSGFLRRVPGGFPGYSALVGEGNLSRANGPAVFGKWETVKTG
ncbi:MAG: hypothetical protein JWN86_3966 [Planctomycetota bacterium]|nr:hypothetical protein [Planctomycetota bacterium]